MILAKHLALLAVADTEPGFYLFGQEDDAVDYARYARQAGIEMRQRTALARDVDHVLVTPQPAKIRLAHEFDDVVENHGLGQVRGADADLVLEDFEPDEEAPVPSYDDDDHALRIAVVGRPNVGKSTLINRLIGEDRLVVYDQPGTTRDSVSVPFEKNDRKYELIDTAGIRRKSKVHEAIEKFSIVKALQAIEKAHVVIAVIDAQEGVTEQDVSLLGLVLERGRALVVVTNKWDGLSPEKRKKVRDDLDRRLPFLDFAERITISALHGTAVGELLPAAERAYKAAIADLSTTELTRELEGAVMEHPPPMVRGRRIRLRYAHQGGRNPPVIVIHGNQTGKVPNSYARYLEKVLDAAPRPSRPVADAGRREEASRALAEVRTHLASN